MSSKITQSVISTNYNCINNPDYTGLINLRRNPYTYDLIGRTNGVNIKFYNEDNQEENKPLSSAYSDFKMRRKAEILQYKNSINSNSPGYVKTDSEIYGNLMKGNHPNGYSKYRLKQILLNNNEEVNCNRVVGRPPSNSGIWFNDTSPESKNGLYLNKNVLFYPRL